MLKRVCFKCQRLFTPTPGASRCDECAAPLKQAAEARRPKKAKPQYADGEYRRNRAILLADPLARCAVCQTNTDLTVDHVTPVSQGGRHESYNLIVLCRRHNAQKAGRSLEQYAAFLTGEELPNVPKA